MFPTAKDCLRFSKRRVFLHIDVYVALLHLLFLQRSSYILSSTVLQSTIVFTNCTHYGTWDSYPVIDYIPPMSSVPIFVNGIMTRTKS